MENPTPLQDLTICEAIGRVWYNCAVPLWVSFVVSVVSLVNSHWGKVLVAAVIGQMALTLIKLFLYTAGLMLSLATALAGFWRVPNVLRWSGERLGRVAFDYSSAVIGVLIGIFPVAFFQKGVGALGATGCDIGLFLCIQALLWVCCYAAFGKLQPLIGKAPWLSRAAGIAFAGLFAWAFFHESWPEVPQREHPQAQAARVSGNPIKRAA